MQISVHLHRLIFNKRVVISDRVLRISSKSRYVGDEAATWFSTLLNSPGCRMYQIYEPRYSMQDTKWGDIALPGDKVPRTKISDLTEAESGLTSAGIPLIEPNISKTRTGQKKCLAPS